MAAGSKVLVRSPASTANLGPGFDSLGMALGLHAWIEMGEADQTRITLHGDELEGVACDESNLIYQVAQRVFAEAGMRVPHLEISMYSDIPLARGLGSSAAAIVGGLVAANELIGRPLGEDDLFQLAARMEGHPDNVGASLFGGMVVTGWDGHRAERIRLFPPSNLEALVVIPEFRLPTETARQVLPSEVPLRDAVFNIGNSSLLVAAFASGELAMLRHAMKDALHQPYRAKLIPGMERILREAVDYGALGVALSGAGPTLIAFLDLESPDKERLERYLIDTFREERIAARTMRLRPDPEGTQILTQPDRNSTFIVNVQRFKGEHRA
jgi:homoserine kinase